MSTYVRPVPAILSMKEMLNDLAGSVLAILRRFAVRFIKLTLLRIAICDPSEDLSKDVTGSESLPKPLKAVDLFPLLIV